MQKSPYCESLQSPNALKGNPENRSAGIEKLKTMLGWSLLVVIAVAAAYSRQQCIEQGRPWFRSGGTRRARKVTPRDLRPPKRRFDSEAAPCLWTHPVVGNNSLPRSFYRLNELTRDRKTSERLVRRVSQMNPGRSPDWCIEKAVYDIERDRMAR